MSVVIHTFNEERNIANAIRSVAALADEVVVVDMESTDSTREIAEQLGSRVIVIPNIGYADPARQFGLDSTTGDWILALDADEMLTPQLAERLRLIAEQDRYDIVSVPEQNYMFGRPLRGTGWEPDNDRHDRFFRRGALSYNAEVHNFITRGHAARVLELLDDDDNHIVHFNYRDISEFLSKLDRYTTLEARQRDGDLSLRALARSVLREALSRGIRHAAWRDGWRGIVLTMLMVTYRTTTWAKAREAREVGSRADIEASYQQVAHRLLADHERRHRYDRA